MIIKTQPPTIKQIGHILKIVIPDFMILLWSIQAHLHQDWVVTIEDIFIQNHNIANVTIGEMAKTTT